MCGGCGWNKGEYSCATWVADAVRDAAEAAQLGEALKKSGLTAVKLAMW